MPWLSMYQTVERPVRIHMIGACRVLPVANSVGESISRLSPPLQPARRCASACTACLAPSELLAARQHKSWLLHATGATGRDRTDHRPRAPARATRARSMARFGGLSCQPPPMAASRRPQLILGIESSCDDTGVAVVSSDGRILGEAIASQACDAVSPTLTLASCMPVACSQLRC